MTDEIAALAAKHANDSTPVTNSVFYATVAVLAKFKDDVAEAFRNHKAARKELEANALVLLKRIEALEESAKSVERRCSRNAEHAARLEDKIKALR